MRFARLKLLPGLFFGVLIAFSNTSFAVEEKPGAEKYLSEFEGIKMRLESIEQTQKDVLTQKDKIFEEIDQVRVWSRHSGSKPK